jgi:cytochrome b
MTDQTTIAHGNARIRVWDLPLRLFHWLLVVAIATAFLSAEEDSPLSQWHIVSGWVAFMLVVFRVAWGFLGGEHARFTKFVSLSAVGHHVRALARGGAEPSVGHNPLGALSVILLLLFVAATVWTGATMNLLTGEEVHEILGWSLLVLVVVHVAAVILMSILTGDNLVRAMIDGTKTSARHPAARDARPPGFLALILGLLVLAGTAVAIHAYDPQAFTLRSTESFEHRAGTGEGARNHDGGARQDTDD